MDILGLPDAGRDALIQAALGPPASAPDAWRRWASGRRDPFDDPIALRWLPLVDRNLPEDGVDAPTRRRLRDIRQSLWAANMRTIEGATSAIQALADADVPVVLLKGAALALTVYESPSLRPIGDVDVLIHPEHLMRARGVLDRLGWGLLRPINERDLALAHGIDLRRSPFGTLDVHWYLLHENCWPGVDGPLWERTTPFERDGLRARVLGPADQLIQVCVHGLRWSPVHSAHWLADAAWIIRRAGSGLDWDVFVNEARRRRLGFQLLEALRTAAAVADLQVPANVFDALARLPASRRDRLECRLKGRPVASPGGLFVIWCGWARAAAAAREAGTVPPQWLRYLAAAVGVPSRPRLVPWALGHVWLRLVGRRGPVRQRPQQP